jgi:hypothetical protein
MAIRDESEFLHVADHQFRELAREVVNFLSQRMREMDPENAGKSQCNGCVGTVLFNSLIFAAGDNRWSADELSEMALDFTSRLDHAVEEAQRLNAPPLPPFLTELLRARIAA